VADAAGLTATHPRHDLLLVASTADRWRGPMPALAAALVAACTECARLHADLVALAAALPVAATPRRPRDFTLTTADAERLRRRGPRAWLRRIGSSRDTITRPLALGLTTLGLAGLLIATVPAVLPSGGVAASGASSAGSAASPAPSSPTDMELQVGAPPGDGSHIVVAPGGDAPRPPEPSPKDAPDPSPAPAALSPFAVLSSLFLATGLGLFAARHLGRRGALR